MYFVFSGKRIFNFLTPEKNLYGEGEKIIMKRTYLGVSLKIFFFWG